MPLSLDLKPDRLHKNTPKKWIGMNFDQTFAIVVKLIIFTVLFVIVAYYNLNIN